MSDRTYLPTPEQLATVALLNAESVQHRWRVDAGPIDGEADEPCADDSDHGPATVYGFPTDRGSQDGYCPPCALSAIELHHTDPYWSGDALSLDVFRTPTER